MARKQRIDSATAAVEVMQAALNEIEVPGCVPLSEAEMPFWDAVIAARSKSEWNDADLITAAHLARTMAKLTIVSETNEWDKLSKLILSMRRSLGLDVRSAQRGADVAKRREQAFEIERQAPKRDYLGLN
jgi:CelD/BcsL family acetyltransferase involved in cellulose biosynthesis